MSDLTIERPLTEKEKASEDGLVDITFRTKSQIIRGIIADFAQKYLEQHRPFDFSSLNYLLEEGDLTIIKSGKLNVDLDEYANWNRFTLVNVKRQVEQRMQSDNTRTQVMIGKTYTFTSNLKKKVYIKSGSTSENEKVTVNEVLKYIIAVDSCDCEAYEKMLKDVKVKGFEILDK